MIREHDCIRDTGDICPRCESAAEDRKYGIEHDTGMSDLEAERFERWIARGWGEE